jgi:hypothetical protein
MIVLDDQPLAPEAREVMDEKIVGDIQVVARLAMGSERLRLFFTDRRMILAHVGKRGAGAVSVTSFFGWLSGGVEDLFKRGRESVNQRGVQSRAPAQILALDKDNFDVNYTEVVSGEVVQEEFSTVIRFLTTNDKLEFRTGKRFEDVVSMIKPFLGQKLSIRDTFGSSRVDRG